ncbi:uncharacterized protein MONOS_11756 [Monocercomonoides exilis]|uniref:uncharacterized protein n=1 Tax=Monocercomonoides exilis TaxID=2049356 RepID=UPI003559B3B7|nr:hypothetical protein MONOS_11756 [Monocercomonoides exilis]|eukprot:MONOS_11756.1-p1 / transcript=MONOS_11756.1 / gene=MONOS_11756 / organism=Monocercomonoides_exilis_PA203 / gene_product=unspecified product / transcript_product=unspecified product / location=Mono_scaffold00608:15299-18259(+) / protein_length=986 / sequence_SO=supercontig / SO=protein_coding / is_pseudo=false
MSQLLQFANETKQLQKRNFTTKDTFKMMRDFIKECKKCVFCKHLAIFLGKSGTGKSTMIDALLGIPLNETWDKKIVKVNESSEGPDIGDGKLAKTPFPEAYKLDDGYWLLDTRGFHGSDIDTETDIISTLILEVYLRVSTKVSVLYLSEFGNYYNFTNLKVDMLLVNDICEDMNLPVLFVANKCFRLNVKQVSNKDPEEKKIEQKNQIKQIEEYLFKQFDDMREDQMKKIKNKYFKQINLSDSDAQCDEKTFRTLIEKANASTGLETINLEKCLNHFKILYMLKKALDENRFIYYDAVNSYSVDRIKGIVRDEQYYVHSNRLSLGRCTPESSMFLNSVSEMAIKLSWLVEAMIGRMFFPKNMKSIKEGCENYVKEWEQKYDKLSSKERNLHAELDDYEQEIIKLSEVERKLNAELRELELNSRKLNEDEMKLNAELEDKEQDFIQLSGDEKKLKDELEHKKQDNIKLIGDEDRNNDELRNLDIENPELLDSRIKNEENSMREIERPLKSYYNQIESLDTDEPVLYDKYHFEKKSGFFSNEIVIEKPVKVPGSMFKFIPGNDYTHANENKLKPRIESGWFRGAFKAEKKTKEFLDKGISLLLQLLSFNQMLSVIGSVGAEVIDPIFKFFMPNKICACEGTIEFYAPSRDIPTNQQKIERCRIQISEILKQTQKAEKNIEILRQTKARLENTKARINETKAQLEITKKKIDETKAKLEITNHQFEHAKKLLENAKTKLEKVNAQLETTKAMINGTKAMIENMKTKIEITEAKIEMTKLKHEETKMMKEVWQKRVGKIEEFIQFCDECDKLYKENREMIEQLYLFAKLYLPKAFVNKCRTEKLMASTSSSFLPSSSVVPSMSSSFEGTQQKSSSLAESSFLPCVCECKAIEEEEEKKEEQDIPLEQQVDENKKIFARFIVALEKLEETHKQQNDISLKIEEKYDAKLVERAVEECGRISNQTVGCMGYLEQFKKMNISIDEKEIKSLSS